MQERERILGAHDLNSNFGPHHNRELSALEDAAIRDVVALQESVGLKSITDGEFRRRICILRSSGSSVLDRETLTLVSRAAPMPPPPPEVSGSPITITVPISYKR